MTTGWERTFYPSYDDCRNYYTESECETYILNNNTIPVMINMILILKMSEFCNILKILKNVKNIQNCM